MTPVASSAAILGAWVDYVDCLGIRFQKAGEACHLCPEASQVLAGFGFIGN
jgi:hypothetical protein